MTVRYRGRLAQVAPEFRPFWDADGFAIFWVWFGRRRGAWVRFDDCERA